MTYAPPTLTALGHLWTDHGGVNLGIVGDTAHQHAGTSYHLGADALIAGAYSAVLPRDKAGLDNAASAIDLGKLDGTLANLQEFSKWLVYHVRADPTKYRDIREVIYSPDGLKVLRWDNNLHALRTGGDGTGQGDDTHLYHTHISFFRDSEYRDKRALFAGYFELPDTATEAKMPTLTSYTPGLVGVVKATANIRVEPKLSAVVLRGLTAPETWTITGTVKGDVDPDGGSDQWYTRWFGGRWEYTAKSNVPVAPAKPAPDCTVAIKAAVKLAVNAAVHHLDAPLAAVVQAQKETLIP